MLNYWNKIRSRLCPKRITRYGTVASSIFDDRTRKERIFDAIERRVQAIHRALVAKRSRSRQVFHSFFDVSTSQWITSSKQIDDICKEKGLEFLHFREIDEEAKRYKAINEREKKEMVKKGMEEIITNVKQGKRSYVREINEKIKQNQYNIKPVQPFKEPH